MEPLGGQKLVDLSTFEVHQLRLATLSSLEAIPDDGTSREDQVRLNRRLIMAW